MYQDIQLFLESLIRTFGDSNVPVSYEFIHLHGKPQEVGDTPFHELGMMGRCYQNAATHMSERFIYTEGFAFKPGLFPLAHAWLTGPDGKVYDPTWGHEPDSQYFGVQFREDFVLDMMFRTGYHSIFESLYLLKMNREELMTYLESGIV